jgi:hypothetical protein
MFLGMKNYKIIPSWSGIYIILRSRSDRICTTGCLCVYMVVFTINILLSGTECKHGHINGPHTGVKSIFSHLRGIHYFSGRTTAVVPFWAEQKRLPACILFSVMLTISIVRGVKFMAFVKVRRLFLSLV